MKIEDLKRIRKTSADECPRGDERVRVRVAMGTSGIAAGAREVFRAFQDEVAARNLTDVVVCRTGERGMTSCEPVVEVEIVGEKPVVYGRMTPDRVGRVVERHIMAGEPVTEFAVGCEG